MRLPSTARSAGCANCQSTGSRKASRTDAVLARHSVAQAVVKVGVFGGAQGDSHRLGSEEDRATQQAPRLSKKLVASLRVRSGLPSSALVPSIRRSLVRVQLREPHSKQEGPLARATGPASFADFVAPFAWYMRRRARGEEGRAQWLAGA